MDKEKIKNILVEKAKKKNLNLNLDDPRTIQEKILWLEIHDINQELRSKCADKILVHDYCREKLGKDICVPILKIYDSPDEIDFKELPDKFVLKCNHGWNMNILVNKRKNEYASYNHDDIKSEDDCKDYIKKWLNIDFGKRTGEIHYSGIESKCFAERMLIDRKQKKSLFDYKFWCFNGKPKMYTINDGNGHGDIMYYDLKGNEMNLYGIESSPKYEHPKRLKEMIEYAEKLSSEFKFVRIDFYEVDDVVYLGEMTFTPGAGMFKYKNRETDFAFGEQLDINGGVSICITAYKAKDYIKECLDSIISQTWFKKNDNWEIIIGVDGCQETLEYLKTIMHLYKNLRIFMMDSNKGTYITSNTIMLAAKYNNLFRFDSDDLMLPNLVETVMQKKGDHSFIRFHCRKMNTKQDVLTWGQLCVDKSTFLKYGGFKPWLCAGDADFYFRIKNIENVVDLPNVLMIRRFVPTSLTHAKETGMKSKLRDEYRAQMDRNITDEKKAVVEMIMNTYEEIVSPIKDFDKEQYMNDVIPATIQHNIQLRSDNHKPEKNQKPIPIKRNGKRLRRVITIKH